MNAKKLTKALLFPHIAFLILLLPSAAVALTYSMLNLYETDPLRIASYVLSAYTLTVWCVRIPSLIRFGKSFKQNNKFMKRWFGDVRLRMKVTLIGNVLWNSAYALFQLCLGLYHGSFWFYSFAAYYFTLAIMRLTLVRHTIQHKPGEKMRRELIRYRACGIIFLFTNLALSGIMLYRIRESNLFIHHEITTIAMASYTFTSLTVAIVNVFRYRKYNSPVYSASKAISLASASVSMLTLESTMLSTFSSGGMNEQTKLLFLALSGAAISIFIISMAIYMIVKADKSLKLLKNEELKNEQ